MDDKESNAYEEIPIKRGFEVDKLHRSLVVPNPVHGYSMAISYITQWFLSHFSDNFFNSVYLSGGSPIAEFTTPIFQNVLKEPPLLAVIPVINYNYDRDRLDLYQMDSMRMCQNFNQMDSFFYDPHKNIRISYTEKEMEIAIQFYLRFFTRSQQIYVKDQMEMLFRVGFTETLRPTVCYNIPKEIIFAIASMNGFEIKNNSIRDIQGFLNYMNTFSRFPITVKMHSLNAQQEFFIQANNVYTHVNMTEKIDVDDGEMKGKDTTNYNLNMNIILHMRTPKFFSMYYREFLNFEDVKKKVVKSDVNVPLFDVAIITPPEFNEHDWEKAISVGYDFGDDESDLLVVPICIEEIFQQYRFHFLL